MDNHDYCDMCNISKEVKWVYTDAKIPISFPICLDCRKSNLDYMIHSVLSLKINEHVNEQKARKDIIKHYGLESAG